MLTQRDPRWSGEIMGYGFANIGAVGCYLTAFCEGLNKWGYSFNPSSMNQILKDRGLWIQENYIDVANLAVKWPEVFESFQSIEPYNDQPTIDAFIKPNCFVVCKVDAKGIGGHGTHFVLLNAVVNGIAQIVDPWTGSVEPVTKKYGSLGNILGLRIFIVKPAKIDNVSEITDDTVLSFPDPWNSISIRDIKSNLNSQKKNIEDLTARVDTLTKAKEDTLLAKSQSDTEAKLWKDKYETFIATLAKMLGTTQDEARIIPEVDTLIKKEDKLTAIQDNRPVMSATPLHKLLEEAIVLLKKLLKKKK
jgi:hypothetical protein